MFFWNLEPEWINQSKQKKFVGKQWGYVLRAYDLTLFSSDSKLEGFLVQILTLMLSLKSSTDDIT
jgi:hypothetical protein